MDSLNNVIAYTCYSFQNNSIFPLANARLTKLIYLVDWIHALNNGRQLTPIQWEFYHYGPYVDNVIDTVESDFINFQINHELNSYGTDRKIVKFIGNIRNIIITQETKSIVDLIINKTKDMSFGTFIDYVYSSYPVTTTERYHYLNLVSLANECKSKGLNF